MTDLYTDIVPDYFDYLAQAFPVMCASDEFHFLPRAEKAAQYYDSLDDLDGLVVAERVSRLKAFRRTFEIRDPRENDLDKQTDLAVLKSSVEGILIELEAKESWRHNPLLYLKIAFIGLDHALTKPASGRKERIDRAMARLGAIPRLLHQGINNLDRVPATYYGASCAMAADCKDYLRELGQLLAAPAQGTASTKSMESALSALEAFTGFMKDLTPIPDHEFPLSSLEATIRDHFLSLRSISEIFEISSEEWQKNHEHLERLRRDIDPCKSWQELYHDYTPSTLEETSTMSLYEREIERLRIFFQEQGFMPGFDSSFPLELCETPTYLRSVRSAASFGAALRADTGEKDLFYITTQPPQKHGGEAGDLLRRRLHREYRFLSAHETIPGHHLLDGVRRGLRNPVRRQIESPLFYEGWAYYAESLLSDYGYVNSPIESLVDSKRRLWRAARCRIDVGLPTGRLARGEAVDLLTTAGFSPQEANAQIDRFRLNPGYQLCYTLGRYEIMRLRQIFGSRMGRDEFHRALLEGGERPFHLIEKAFEAEYA